MHAPRLPRHALLLAALLLPLFALAARADSRADVAAGHRSDDVVVAQAAPQTAAPTAAEAPPEHAHPAAAPPPEELPRMTNKAAAFWGVAFMLTVCVAFSAFAGYAIYRTHKQKP